MFDLFDEQLPGQVMHIPRANNPDYVHLGHLNLCSGDEGHPCVRDGRVYRHSVMSGLGSTCRCRAAEW